MRLIEKAKLMCLLKQTLAEAAPDKPKRHPLFSDLFSHMQFRFGIFEAGPFQLSIAARMIIPVKLQLRKILLVK